MRIYQTLGRELIHDKDFSIGSVVLVAENGAVLVCSNFKMEPQGRFVYCWNPADHDWHKARIAGKYADLILSHHRYCQKQNRKGKKFYGNYASMMKHSRRKKSGSGGSFFINTHQITEHECRKEPYHDFRRCYN